MKIALTGDSGHLGTALMQEIGKRGFTVKALVRDDKLPFPKDMPVEIVKGDLLELGSVKKLVVRVAMYSFTVLRSYL